MIITIILLLAFSLAHPESAFALGDDKPIHHSADKTFWDRKSDRVELIGHAVVNQPGETLAADYMMLDLKTRVVDAKGNCVYIASDSVIYGEEMHFNLETRTGTIVQGRVTNEKFNLSGELIHRLGPGRFQTHWGNYSTCRDCLQSWSFMAQDVDMEIEGYAYFSNVTSEVEDVPTFWLPYLVVPLKTHRQTGLLFPQFSLSGSNGATILEPFFWAINRSSDMTIAAGDYSARGPRAQWEGRYALTGTSGGQANFYYQNDQTFGAQPNRMAVNITQTQELPFGIIEKLKLTELTDNLYPYYFGDVPGSGEAYLPSTLSLNYDSSNVSAYIALTRIRNLTDSSPNPVNQQTEFDPRTVQALPKTFVTTNNQFLFGTPIAAGLSVDFTNFTRTGGPFDYDNSDVAFGSPVPAIPPPYNPGVDPIREATRFSFSPTVYTTFRPFDVFSVVPSITYHGYLYNFSEAVPNLYRSYFLLQADISTQLEKIYEFPDDPTVPRAKNLIRPLLTASYTPNFLVNQNLNHPFLQQIQNAQNNGWAGYNFDDNDIIPLYATPNNLNYFTPIGESLAYGFTTQWIRRRSAVNMDSPSYQTSVEWSAGQAYSFETAPGQFPEPMTRVFSDLNLSYDHFNSQTTYYWYPYVSGDHSTISTSVTAVLEKGIHQQVMSFDRSITLGYSYDQVVNNYSNMSATLNYSINDYILPSVSVSYAFLTSQLLSASGSIQYQSPSRCWLLATNLGYTSGVGVNFGVNWALNLTGGGYGGVSDVANAVQSH